MSELTPEAAANLENIKKAIIDNMAPKTDTQLPLSVVIITCEQDKHFLPGCLESIPRGSEVIIAYTHPEKREGYDMKPTQRVVLDASFNYFIQGLFIKEFTIAWDERDLNLADLRNMAKSNATREFILSLDTDERVKIPLEIIYELINLKDKMPDMGGFHVQICNYSMIQDIYKAWNNSPLLRLYRNKPEFQYKNRIHEEITPSIIKAGYQTGIMPIIITHLGYKFDTVKPWIAKLTRNLVGMYKDLAHDPTNMMLNIKCRETLNELNNLGVFKIT